MMKRDDGSMPVQCTGLQVDLRIGHAPPETATLRTVSSKTNYIVLPLQHTQASPLVHLSLYVCNLCTQGGSKHLAGPGVSKTSHRV